ncbi:MAG: type II toxin-antitoxin system Phd/YefM family antitoxin [Lachnospiraceae bacterium]|nr:type II toxin-antitoxin system Phd/YefM family antitoxin [Lachnospiraceae bacterium]
MNTDLLEFTERLVPISDFSQGKAGKVFNDVAKNDRDYIVLKNNQPIAVLVSVNEYRNMQERIARLEKLVKETEETTKNLL